jgi:hypothetical protein
MKKAERVARELRAQDLALLVKLLETPTWWRRVDGRRVRPLVRLGLAQSRSGGLTTYARPLAFAREVTSVDI